MDTTPVKIEVSRDLSSAVPKDYKIKVYLNYTDYMKLPATDHQLYAIAYPTA